MKKAKILGDLRFFVLYYFCMDCLREEAFPLFLGLSALFHAPLLFLPLTWASARDMSEHVRLIMNGVVCILLFFHNHSATISPLKRPVRRPVGMSSTIDIPNMMYAMSLWFSCFLNNVIKRGPMKKRKNVKNHTPHKNTHTPIHIDLLSALVLDTTKKLRHP
ncbi:hypothetical protein P8610_05255 [Fictibacillus sp. UD]